MARAEKIPGGYKITITERNGVVVLNVADSGRVEDASGMPVVKSDVNIVCTMIPKDLQGRVRAWWQGHSGGDY